MQNIKQPGWHPLMGISRVRGCAATGLITGDDTSAR